MTIVLKTFLVLLFLSGCGDSSGVQITDQINVAMEKEMADGFSGAVLVAKEGKIIFDKAYGEVRGKAVETTSRFWISSTGKQFVSAAILKAQEQKLLSLDDPISRFFPNAPEDKKNITIGQLLSHTSGMEQSHASEHAKNKAEAAALIFAEPLAWEPGFRFWYSNSNYQMAAAIIEVVSGGRYIEFIKTELFFPLGLNDTGQTSEVAYADVFATVNDLPERLKKNQWGSQGMFSTTHDLFKWYRALQSAEILTEASVHMLFNATVKIGEGKAALGWFESFTKTGVVRIFTRGNDDYGTNSLIYAYPDENIVIIILTHAGEKNDDISFSRSAHGLIEAIMFP